MEKIRSLNRSVARTLQLEASGCYVYRTQFWNWELSGLDISGLIRDKVGQHSSGHRFYLPYQVLWCLVCLLCPMSGYRISTHFIRILFGVMLNLIAWHKPCLLTTYCPKMFGLVMKIKQLITHWFVLVLWRFLIYPCKMEQLITQPYKYYQTNSNQDSLSFCHLFHYSKNSEIVSIYPILMVLCLWKSSRKLSPLSDRIPGFPVPWQSRRLGCRYHPCLLLMFVWPSKESSRR